MSANSITLSGRRAAERIMVDACSITRGPTKVFNPSTHVITTTGGAAVYTGKCRLRSPMATPRASGGDQVKDLGGKPASIVTHMISVPITATTVQIDDVVTITASALGGETVGLTLRVVDVAQGTHLTARRLVCEAVER